MIFMVSARSVRRASFYSVFLVSSIFSNALKVDLELFSSAEGTASGIFEKLNKTCTIQGSNALRNLLQSPTSNVTTLHTRRAATEYFVKNEKLAQDLHKNLTAFATTEADFMAALNHVSQNKTLKGFYYSTGQFNKLTRGKLSPLLEKLDTSSVALGFGVGADFTTAAGTVVTHGGMALASWFGAKNACCHDHGHEKKVKSAHAADAKPAKSHKEPHTHSLKEIILKRALKGFAFVHAYEIIPALYGLWKFQDKVVIIKSLQENLITVSKKITHLKLIHSILEKHPEFINKLTQYQDLKNVCELTNISDKLKQLLILFSKNTFKNKPSTFSNYGNILLAHKLLQEVGHELTPALQALGEVDAHLSNSKLVTEEGYSFAEYIENATSPSVEITNFSHPFVTESTINNSVKLGAQGAKRNLLLSGQNKCGKSTTLKSIALSVYLAQTLCVSHKIRLTPFDGIIVSRKKEDNTAQGKSGLEVEALEAEELITFAKKSSEAGKFTFIALDEPINGTNDVAKELVTCNCFRDLFGCKNTIIVATTHCKPATELAKEQEYNCSNYTLRGFKLHEGIGDFDNALALLEEKHPHLANLFRVRVTA